MRTLANLSYAVAGLVVTLYAWLVLSLESFRGMYASFRAPLPLVTRIALSPAWGYVSLIAVASSIVVSMLGRKTHPRMPIAVALIAIGVLVGTYAAIEWPIFQLAGNIR